MKTMWKKNLNGKAMKRLRIILGIMVAIIVSAASIGCTEEINVQQGIPEGTITREFTASFAELTKTALEEGGKVSWCKGDTIWYYTENRGEIRYHIIKEDCRSAAIEVKMDENAQFVVAFYGDSEIVYNYYGMIEINGLAGIYQDGSFNDAHLSVAQCFINESSDLVFKNITSMIKFSLSRNDIHYISLTSNDGKPLSYPGYGIDLYSDPLYIFPISETGDNTIYAKTGGSGTFYIGLNPVVMEKGFTIECYNKNMQYLGTVRSTKRLTLDARQIINLGTLDDRIYDHEFRIYHMYGPAPEPPIDPVPPLGPNEEHTPIPPDSPDYQTDRTQHIFGDNCGNIATVSSDTEKGGYIFTFGGDTRTEEGKKSTIVGHTDNYGKLEYFVLNEQLFGIEYTDSEVIVSYTDNNGELHKYGGYENPYNGYIVNQDPVGIYEGIISPSIELLLGFGSKDLVSKFYGTGLAALAVDNAWNNRSFEDNFRTTLIAGSIGVIISAATGNVWWALASEIKLVIDAGLIVAEYYTDTVAEKLYLNASPITLDWEQTKNTTVRLTCQIANKGSVHDFKVGIIIGSGKFLTKIYNDYSQLQNVGEEDIYEFTFSSLKPGKTYYYCAVLAPSDTDESNIMDFWRYGNKKEFKLSADFGDKYTSGVDLGLSVKWANCNLGATSPEDAGYYLAWGEVEPKESYSMETYKYATADGYYLKYCLLGRDGVADYQYYLLNEDNAVYVKLGEKWDIPTRYEWAELLQNCTWKWKNQNGVNGYQITGKNGNSIFIPAAGRMSYENVKEYGVTGEYWQEKLWDQFWDSACYAACSTRFSSNLSVGTYPPDHFAIRINGLPIRPVLRR